MRQEHSDRNESFQNGISVQEIVGKQLVAMTRAAKTAFKVNLGIINRGSRGQRLPREFD